MNISARSNVNPQQTIQDAARTGAIGQAPAAGNATPRVALPSQDQVSQSAGANGRAGLAPLVGNSPYTERIRSLLQVGDFDAIAQVVRQAGARGLGQLDLSVAEIQKIAQGLGQGSWSANLPMLASYSSEEQDAIASLIGAAGLSANERVYSLKTFIGPEAVFSYARSASVQDLRALSTTNRQLMLSVLDPGNSVWGSISGAANEAVLRRAVGNSEQVEDALASKVLRSARNETELRDLLGKLNQFNRDDVVFRYVMDLSPQELAGLSDGMKRELLSKLVDTGVQLPFLNVDLNSVANLDETLGMTFQGHAQAARRLYVAMKPAAQQSEAVQDLVKKSDLLMEQLSQIEQTLNQEVRSGQLTTAKINEYRQTLQALQSQNAGKPEVQQKVQALMNTLSRVQEQLGQAAQTRAQSTAELSQARQQLQGTEASLAQLKNTMTRTSGAVTQAGEQLKSSETRLLAAYQQALDVRRQAGDLGQEYTQLLTQMEGLLSKGQSARGRLPQLEQITGRLRHLESQLQGQQAGVGALQQQLSQVGATLDGAKTAYNSAVGTFNSRRGELASSQQRLGTLLQTYTRQIATLEQEHGEAKAQLDALAPGSISDAQRIQLQQELDGARHEIDAHQASHSALKRIQTQELAPAAARLETAQAELAPQQAALEAELETVSEQENALVSFASTVVETVVDAWDSVRELASAATAYVGNLRQRLSQLKPEELSQERQKLEAMHAQLKAEAGPDVSQVAAELRQLEGLLGQISELESQVSRTETAHSELAAELQHIEQRQGLVASELQSAQQAARQAGESLATARSGVDAVQGRLGALDQQLQNYDRQISEWTQRLNAVNASTAQAKSEFLTQLQVQPGLSEEEVLGPTLAAADRERANIERELSTLRQQTGAIRSQMQTERQTLRGYEQQLSTQASQLTRSQDKILAFQQELAQLDQAGRQLVTKVDQALTQMAGSDNQAVQEALGKLRAGKETLQNLSQQTQQLLQGVTSGSDAISRQQREITRTQGQLQERVQDITQFENGSLRQLESGLDSRQASLDQVKARDQALRAEITQLVDDITSGRVNISMEELQQKRAELVSRAQGQGGMSGEIQALLQRVDALLGSAQSANQTADSLAGEVDAIVSRSEAAVGSALADVAKLEGEMGQIRQDMREIQQQILQSQRTLLERRKSLGIDSQVYQAALQRSLELVNAGRPLTPEEAQELQALEGRLSSIEAAQVDLAGPLAQQITSLNMMKSRVNASLQTLAGKSADLEALQGELQRSRVKVVQSVAELRAVLPQLQQERSLLVGQLDQLRRNPMGISNYQALLETLESKVAAVDAQIGLIEANLQKMTGSLGKIDLASEQVARALERLSQVRGELELLSGQLSETTHQLEDILMQFNALQNALGKINGEVKAAQTQVSALAEEIAVELPPETPVISGALPARADEENTTSREIQTQRQSENRRQSFSENLTNRLTTFWSTQRRQTEARRDAEISSRREEFLADVQQRLVQVQQYSEDLEAYAANDTQLAAITDHLLSPAQNG